MRTSKCTCLIFDPG